MNLPNKITFARICLIPIMLLFLLVHFDLGYFELDGKVQSIGEIIAVLVFLIAAMTDGLDGYVARKYQLVTNLGKLLDPLADKLLIAAALVSLVEMDRLAAWMAIVIISREFAVSGLRQIAASDGHVIAASKLGKWKTATQIVAIVFLMLNNFPFTLVSVPFAQIAIWVALGITVWSGVDYFVKNKSVLKVTS